MGQREAPVLVIRQPFYKFNRYNKSSLRALVITDKYIAKLDSISFKLLKEPIPLLKVTRISLCPEPNGLFIIHVPDNDIIGCMKNPKDEERVGELVGVLLYQFERKGNLKQPEVIISPALDVCLGGKWRAVRIFPADATQQAVFKKNGNDIDLICHNLTTV
ncbi:unnamed protein product [Strongylus vulgaris]|uniref:TH1 domain-containing protein n=1 Tax=Strongylus vulgaris TaxID=40348 RepID=A0A3P7KCT7_STRVU|nr:unnamed protein product [Strongylus vulgaris]